MCGSINCLCHTGTDHPHLVGILCDVICRVYPNVVSFGENIQVELKCRSFTSFSCPISLSGGILPLLELSHQVFEVLSILIILCFSFCSIGLALPITNRAEMLTVLYVLVTIIRTNLYTITSLSKSALVETCSTHQSRR